MLSTLTTKMPCKPVEFTTITVYCDDGAITTIRFEERVLAELISLKLTAFFKTKGGNLSDQHIMLFCEVTPEEIQEALQQIKPSKQKCFNSCPCLRFVCNTMPIGLSF